MLRLQTLGDTDWQCEHPHKHTVGNGAADAPACILRGLLSVPRPMVYTWKQGKAGRAWRCSV